MLGRALVGALEGNAEVTAVDLDDFDIGDGDAVMAAMLQTAPDVVFNCAAYTNVDGAESDRETAFRVNAVGAGNVARAAAEAGARLLHVSTDYVFDGRATEPYAEDAPTDPSSVYGQSKLAGEREVLSACGNALIVRTAWLYGHGGRNFVETVLRLADGGDTLRIVDDQTGSPTYATDLAAVLKDLAATDVAGYVHATNSGTCTWYEFATAILNAVGRDDVPVEPIATEDFGRPAPRPRYSVLSLERLEEVLGWTPRHWKKALVEYLRWRNT
ncbi:MAG: dTDP-4-dehydrorhamnose reductase [Candidatus Eisenbacteria bacterium]|nr:dTDP-4-dehydrorhamnose reductase [Candidatus Eisenbacteria bacterium]